MILGSRWKPPFEPTETSVFLIQGYPLAAGLNCERGVPRIRHKIPSSIGVFADSGKERPMLRPGLDQHAMRLCHDRLAKGEDFAESARLRENSGVGGNADDPAQYLRRDAVARMTVDNSFQPASADLVFAGISPESVNEDVDVRKYHRPSIKSSRVLERFKSTPGSVPPEALETGNLTRVRVAGFGPARMARRPSSTREVRVRPSSAAFFLALRSKSWGSRIVVLIRQSIQLKHQYVKAIGEKPQLATKMRIKEPPCGNLHLWSSRTRRETAWCFFQTYPKPIRDEFC
jgi:hypothetical protein